MAKRKKKEYKVEYNLYDFSKKCDIGYGGTAYHRGYIIFYDDYLSIEDHEIDQNDGEEPWFGSELKHKILSDKYLEIISNLSQKYRSILYEKEDDTIKNIFLSLKTPVEKMLFGLLISVTRKKKGIMRGGELVDKICGKKIPYQFYDIRFDHLYPDCDDCNRYTTRMVNDDY